MLSWQDYVWRLLGGLLAIFLGGGLLAGTVTFIAVSIPPVANHVFCPTGRVARANPDPAKRDSKEFAILCYDQRGSAVVALPQSESQALERKYFYTPSYILTTLLVVSWFVRPFLRQKMRNKSKAAV